MSQQLPAELVSLIHHLHLNEAGWWDKGIRQFIVSIVWLNGTMRPDAVSQALQDQYSITLETGESSEASADLVIGRNSCGYARW